MKKSVAIILVIVVVLAAVIGFMVFANNDDDMVSQNNDTTQASDNADALDSSASQDQDQTSDSEDQPAAGTAVAIKDYSYAPQKITVKKGATVTWTNQDNVKHDVTPNEITADFKASDLLDMGDSFSVTFNETGTFEYFCSLHPYMTGTVEVVE